MKKLLLTLLLAAPLALAMDTPKEVAKNEEIKTIDYKLFTCLPIELQARIVAHVGAQEGLAKTMRNLKETNTYFNQLIEEHGPFITELFDQDNKNSMPILAQMPKRYLSKKTQGAITEWKAKGHPLLDFIQNLPRTYDPDAVEESIREKIQNGADVNYEDKQGNTPLIIAYQRNRLDVANFLIYNGANLVTFNKKAMNKKESNA